MARVEQQATQGSRINPGSSRSAANLTPLSLIRTRRGTNSLYYIQTLTRRNCSGREQVTQRVAHAGHQRGRRIEKRIMWCDCLPTGEAIISDEAKEQGARGGEEWLVT